MRIRRKSFTDRRFQPAIVIKPNDNMKLLKLFFLLSLTALAVCFSSCRGSAGKRAATEATEFIEKKGGKLLEKEGSRAVEEEESAAQKYLKAKRRADRVQDMVDGFTEDEPQYQPQPVAVVCGQCGGSGAVYLVDGYGNIVYDYYGNPQVSVCPVCGGTGQQIVYQ